MNRIDKIFDYILPIEYIESIKYLCSFYEISQMELLKKSLIFYMQYFSRNIDKLPDERKIFEETN